MIPARVQGSSRTRDLLQLGKRSGTLCRFSLGLRVQRGSEEGSQVHVVLLSCSPECREGCVPLVILKGAVGERVLLTSCGLARGGQIRGKEGRMIRGGCLAWNPTHPRWFPSIRRRSFRINSVVDSFDEMRWRQGATACGDGLERGRVKRRTGGHGERIVGKGGGGTNPDA